MSLGREIECKVICVFSLGDSNLICLYDLLNAAPELFAAKQLHLLEPLGNTLKDVSETMRINVAQVYAILWAFGLSDDKFDEEVGECLTNLTQKTLEHKHGWLLVLGHTFNRKIAMLKQEKKAKDFATWPQFVNAVKIICKFDPLSSLVSCFNWFLLFS